jgi:oligopeptide transport system substrate-binding protein
MLRSSRKKPAILLGIVALAASLWAMSFSQLPPADFTFCNGTEIKTVDPAIVTGQPEGRIIRELFECLVNWHSKTLEPTPGVAREWTVSDDLLTHTFHLRDDALWSDGAPVTAEDFHWSFQRFLHPDTAAEYAYQLWYVEGAEKYTRRELAAGDAVEIELVEKSKDALPHARGKVVYGKLLEIEQPAPKSDEPVYVVELADGKQVRYRKDGQEGTTRFRWLLPDFRQVGITVKDAHTIEFRLKHPVPYFVRLLGFYPLSPVNRRCIETHGYPAWTKPENIVTNGPFLLKERRIRDRIRLVKNPRYWNRDAVSFNIVDALAIDSTTTALNLYETGQCDWVPKVPNTIIPELRGREDFISKPYLSIYFYRLNTTRPPLDDPRVRRALNLALDKQEIVDKVARGGELPATSLVPPGIEGYEPGRSSTRNVDEARRLLAEAGYPGGRGIPKIEILYNSMESHRSIAELIQSQWKETLGIDVGLANQEWSVYQSSVRQLHYDVARAGWIGDYVDPNTFLDMYVTGGENNQTGWSNARYDELIERAQGETDAKKRFEYFQQAETILMDELPILPLYYYTASELVRPGLRGYFANAQDVHPIAPLSWETSKSSASRSEVSP